MLKTVENSKKQYWKTNNNLYKKNVISSLKNKIAIYTKAIIKNPNWKPVILHKLIMAFLTRKTA